MKKSKKKKIEVIAMHQHQDESGHVFGAPHPINAKHKNKNTQDFHELTIFKEYSDSTIWI